MALLLNIIKLGTCRAQSSVGSAFTQLSLEHSSSFEAIGTASFNTSRSKFSEITIEPIALPKPVDFGSVFVSKFGSSFWGGQRWIQIEPGLSAETSTDKSPREPQGWRSYLDCSTTWQDAKHNQQNGRQLVEKRP